MSDEPDWLVFFQDRERLHAEACLALAQKNARPDPVAHDRLEADIGNLLKAAAWLWEQQDQHGTLMLADALWVESDFLRSRGLIQRAVPLLEHARAAARQTGDLSAEFTWLEALGFVHYATGNHSPALSHYEQALALAEQINEPGQKAQAQLGLGRLQVDLGQLETAESLLKAALDGFRQSHDHMGEITALIALGTLCSLQGNLSGARAYLEKALALAQTRQDPKNEASVHYMLGYVDVAAQDWSMAAGHFEAAVETAAAAGNRSLEARGTTALGEVRLAQGDAQGAASLLETALARQETRDDILAQAFTRYSLAKVYNVLGELDKSLAQLYQAYPYLLEMKHAPIAAAAAGHAAWIMADIYLRRSKGDEARLMLQRVLELAPAHLAELRHEAEALLESLP
jgi:tetratricopeptide (TPR) repeat protein